MATVGTEPATPARPAPLMGLAIVLGIVAVLAGYIGLAVLLNIKAFWAGSVLAWYWFTVGQGQLKALPAAVLGSLAGLAAAALFTLPPTILGGAGAWLGFAAVIVALWVLVMGWIPWVVNPAFMLMLTVATIPAILGGKAFPGMAVGVCFAAAYLGGIVGAVQFLQSRKRA